MNVTASYYRMSHLVLLVYDASKDDPKLQPFIDQIEYHLIAAKIVIVAAKSDLGVSQAGLAIAQKHASDLKTKVFQVSTTKEIDSIT